MAKFIVKALINIMRDEKLIKVGETFEIEESEVERMKRHEAIEIVAGPVEIKSQKIIQNPLDNSNLSDQNSEGNTAPADNLNPENRVQDGNIAPVDNSNNEDEAQGGEINPVDDSNLGEDSDDEVITLEEIQEMTVPQIKKLAEDNNIELKGKLKDELAQELFDKLGEE